MSESFIGTGVAVVTPFNEDHSIDFDSLGNIIDHQIANGIDYLVVLGSTAESAVLNKTEKKEVADFFVQKVQKRLPLVLGLGGNDTRQLVKDIQDTDLNAFDAILSVCPFYNKPNQKGLFAHFSEIAKNCPTQIILYNVPGRTASNLEASTVVKLANEFENIVAIKEASGNLNQIMDLLSSDIKKNFNVISGDDALTLPLISIGAMGVISVFAQAYPYEFGMIVDLALKNEFDEAREMHFDLLPLMDSIYKEGNPAGIKYLLSKMGLCKNILRLPLVSISEKLALEIDARFIQID